MPRVAHRVVPFSQLRAWSDAGVLFAVLDACDTPAVPERCRALPPDAARSLYQGRADETLWAIAPYLVRVTAEMLAFISTELWMEPWGVFVHTSATFEAVYRHFRQFLVVDAPDGASWYFRFYDPRVLPRYLATCTSTEVVHFFGPLEEFIVAHGGAAGMRPATALRDGDGYACAVVALPSDRMISAETG